MFLQPRLTRERRVAVKEKSKNFAKQKGARAEREAIQLLQPIVDKVYFQYGLEAPTLQRNQMQSHMGGFDIVGVEWMALEIKHQETLHVNQWWAQTKRQAGKSRVPILMYKVSRVGWLVLMRARLPIQGMEGGGIRVSATVTLENFLAYFEARTRQSLEQKRNMEA